MTNEKFTKRTKTIQFKKKTISKFFKSTIYLKFNISGEKKNQMKLLLDNGYWGKTKT